MPSFCVVSNCEYKYASAANISFHKFPLNNPELLKKWIEFTDRGPDWFPSKWSSICSRHFLPSDFRIQHLRKCLKRTAAPSVTMKSLDFNSIPANDFSESHYKAKRIVCRLCARSGTEAQSKSIAELNTTLVKCLPTIRLTTLEHLSNEVCGDCIKKLVQYSLFIDRVVSVQKEFFGISLDEADVGHAYHESSKESTTKPLIIKQEPIANIKQEIFEFNKSTRNVDDYHPSTANGQDYYTDAESDAYCEFCDVYFINNVELKNHIVDFHQIINRLSTDDCGDNRYNPRERANNCEIMEIITLENAAFIDLDENCVGETTESDNTQLMERVLKVEKTTETDQHEVLIQVISIEHNYALPLSLSPITEDRYGSIVRNMKQEEMNVQVKSLIQPQQLRHPDIIDNEIEPIIAEQESVELAHEIIETEHLMEKCTKCHFAFDSQTSLNEHMQSVHASKTKICPICTAHCRSIYHYFMHRSKYHNWSKPRRPKRKLHYKCSDCAKMFLSKFAFDNHKKLSCASMVRLCSICHLEFSSGVSMLIHKRICKVLMGKMETVDGHAKVNKRMKMNARRKEIHSSGRSGQNVVKQTPTRHIKLLSYKLHRHRPRDTKDIQTIISVSSASPMESSLPCHSPKKEYSCGKQFKTFQKFKAHQGTHHTSSSDSTQVLYSCNFCKKQFPIRSYLHQHLVTHNDERKHKCTMCTKVFKRLAGLNQHIRGYHYKIKPHVCTVCKHSYALKGDMRRCRHSTLQNKT